MFTTLPVLMAIVAGNESLPKPTPHRAAFNLVWERAQARIRQLDPAKAIGAGKQIGWVVKRHLDPSTKTPGRMFTVVYRVDGDDIAAWNVDIRGRSVLEQRLGWWPDPRRDFAR